MMTRAVLGACIVVLSVGCLPSPSSLDRSIDPLPLDLRTPIFVSDTVNESPIPAGAQLAGPTHDMLIELLTRSRRFVVVGEAAGASYSLQNSLLALLDEDSQESLVYGGASVANSERTAVVEMRFRLVGPGGLTFLSGDLSGACEVSAKNRIPIPDTKSLETGAYWNTAFGKATRECLDELVRSLCEVL